MTHSQERQENCNRHGDKHDERLLDFDVVAFMLATPLPFVVECRICATHYEFTAIQMFRQARYQISGEAILSP